MTSRCCITVLALLVLLAFFSLPATADPLIIDFDAKMIALWTQTSWWGIIAATGYLPLDFTLHPTLSDMNGGFDISVQPIELYPNNILDSDELALIAAILADPTFSTANGASHQEIHDAWNQNFNQIRQNLGCCVGGPENLFNMFPEIDYLIAGLMTLGDQDSMAFPLLLMDLVVNNETVAELVHDPNVTALDISQFALMYKYLAWCGDADGDGCSNLTEYQYFYPIGGRAAYTAAALNPNQFPPDCNQADRLCDGSGGLLGEYFDERNMTNLKLTRIDQQVSFNWGNGTPSPLLDANTFSVCWTGWVVPDYSEAYTFSVRTDDGVRLWVNNELLVDEWNDHGSTTYTGTPSAPLVAGRKYPIRMDFYENGGDAVAWLGWASARQTPGGATRGIYETNLVPGYGIGDRTAEWIQNPHNGHCYKLTEPMTWEEGRILAQSLDAHLVSIEDASENTWIYHTFGVVGGSFYIGANDKAVEGQWVWDGSGVNFWNGAASGAAVSGRYANWNGGEPNDSGGNEDCGQFYASGGGWNDLNGTSALRSLMERDYGIITFTGPSPAGARVREGSQFAFEVKVERSWGQVSYQWMQNGEDLPGETNARLLINRVGLEHVGSYACKIWDESPASVQTGEVLLEVMPREILPLADSWALMGAIAGILAIMGCLVLGRNRISAVAAAKR